MTAPPPRRPWWKRKRTWAAVALLVTAYPASYGVWAYLYAATGVSYRPVELVYSPLRAATSGYRIDELPTAIRWYRAYLIACHRLGNRRAASD